MQADPGVPLRALEIDRSIHNAAASPRSEGSGLLYYSNPCSTLLYSDANTAKRTWPISINPLHTKQELLYSYWSYGDESSVCLILEVLTGLHSENPGGLLMQHRQ